MHKFAVVLKYTLQSSRDGLTNTMFVSQRAEIVAEGGTELDAVHYQSWLLLGHISRL